MSDLDERLKRADRVPVADLWPEIETREPKPAPREPHVRRAIAIVAALAVAAAAIGLTTWAFRGTSNRLAAVECPTPFRPIPHPTIALPKSLGDSLGGVTALAPDDAWAVGSYGSLSNGPLSSRNQILHWNGRDWRQVPAAVIRVRNESPSPPVLVKGRIGLLMAVSAASSDDVWAVGSAAGPLIEHWDGNTWSQVSSPRPAQPTGGYLSGVVAISADDAWAVGSWGSGALIEHWDGTRWSIVHGAAPQASLGAVTATGPNDVWVVGASTSTNDAWGGGVKSLIEHWDGSVWRVVPGVEPAPHGSSSLSAVAALSEQDAWAVGWWGPAPGANNRLFPLLEHWDGHRWSLAHAPPFHGPAHRYPDLADVTAAGSHDVWAVGSIWGGKIGNQLLFHPLVLHWDGERWEVVPSPRPSSATEFHAVTALPSGQVWIVGQSLRDQRTELTRSVIEEGCRPDEAG